MVKGPEEAVSFQQTVKNFMSFPWPYWAVTIVGFLNEYRGDGFNMVQYQYITNEFGISDLEAGQLLGVASTVGIVAGFCGSALTDYYGVRRMACVGLPIACLSRAILTFGRSRTSVAIAIVGLKPPGEALMGAGMYMIAIKKLTTERNRPLGYGMQWGIWSLADLIAAVVAESIRQRVFEGFKPYFGFTFTGLRVCVLITWFVVIIATLFVFLFIFNETAVDLLDQNGSFQTLDEVDLSETQLEPETWRALSVLKSGTNEGRSEAISHLDSNFRPKLRGRFWGTKKSPFETVIIYKNKPLVVTKFDTERTYVITPTEHEAKSTEVSCSSYGEFFYMKNFWRAIVMTLCLFGVSKQWGDLGMVLPVFLERNFGSDVPIYFIGTIHSVMMMFLPTLFSAMTSHLPAFSVMLPGVWIMALAPLPLFLLQEVWTSILWVVILSIGALIWAPRLNAWTASLAPEGREGVFFAVLNVKDIIVALPSNWFNGWLNEVYNPNCPACRDDVGFFCQNAVDGNRACSSANTECFGDGYANLSLFFDNAANATMRVDGDPCPATCFDCPGWETQGRMLWGIILATSLSSPIIMTLCKGFLTGSDLNKEPEVELGEMLAESAS